MQWQPSASIGRLKKRAQLIQDIRQFFVAKGFLEVETPLLSHATVTDPHIHSIPAEVSLGGKSKTFYLQTSPEYAMKRLLAAGSGPIFQITKAFRQGDIGRIHNPEFTMLEWYRPGFDHHLLMDEVDELLQQVFKTPCAERITYAALFKKYIGLNPHTVDIKTLQDCAAKHSIQLYADNLGHNDWLDVLMSHVIEPQMGNAQPIFLYDFPVSHAALAKIRHAETPVVASRFEVYFQGMELANGFHELQNAEEQRQRFEKDLFYRKQHGIAEVPMDELFLAGLVAGIPDCAGVAVGIDRLVMLALQAEQVSEVMSFSIDRA